MICWGDESYGGHEVGGAKSGRCEKYVSVSYGCSFTRPKETAFLSRLLAPRSPACVPSRSSDEVYLEKVEALSASSFAFCALHCDGTVSLSKMANGRLSPYVYFF